MSNSLAKKVEWIKETACRVPVLGVLVRASLSGSKDHAKDMAASIAFFSFLSLFPLLLGGVALASSVLESQQLRSRIMEGVNEFFPVGADFVTENIESLVRLRGAAGLASILILLWSARKMVGAISRGINLALHMDREFSFFLSPLRNFALVVGITLLTVSTTALSPIADVLSELDPGVLDPELQKLVDVVGGHLASFAATGIMIAFTYLLVPFKRPGWHDLWPGLLTATLLIELGKKAFVIYVENVSRLDALYGSITSIIVLMLWLYFFGRILLYGAEVIYDRQQAQPSGIP